MSWFTISILAVAIASFGFLYSWLHPHWVGGFTVTQTSLNKFKITLQLPRGEWQWNLRTDQVWMILNQIEDCKKREIPLKKHLLFTGTLQIQPGKLAEFRQQLVAPHKSCSYQPTYLQNQ